ncbi:MAG: outer membrane beta-barrel protein [Flavobacterium sp.]|uniref:outer membrane beta-barrel protein n=1 Tax=Flavobacterium sp. TaxID=239 RepID=UPI003BCF3E1F
MKYFLFFLLISQFIFSQERTVDYKISGYIETYYAYDFNTPNSEMKLPFMYNYNRHNEFNVNIGLLRVKAEYENVYAIIALHSGTYVDDNYASENNKLLNEAFVGLYLDSAKKQTIEVGILPSYIGFETAISSSNLTLTRSLLAENSPYYMTGVKYGYKPNEKWSLAFLVTNGWQRIKRTNTKIPLALGTQISYKTKEKSLFNWSSYLGKEVYNDYLGMRFFNNFYWDYQCNSHWRIISGFDIGIQDIDPIKTDYHVWYSPVIMTQYTWNNKWQTTFRAEYYQDKNNIIIASNGDFKTFGSSINMDYNFNEKVKFRTEARYLQSQEKVFLKDELPINNNFFITTSLAFEF